ncbi:MAG: CaiB/BaiF CoA transferase family protein [Acidimicrobiia bacterium]
MKPLEDIRIVAIEQYGAGPFATLHLADLGAEVIKIEDPRFGGDVGRYVPPYQDGEDSLFYETFNRNKQSLSLDISTPEGRRVFEDLVAVSDVVFSNLRGDVPAKLRITYDDLKHLNEKIVCVSLSGFGMVGPRADEPGYDYVLQGLAGWMSLTGEPEAPPTKTGLSLVDFSGGFVGAATILAGVHAARRDGKGMDCDVSLYDTAVGLLTYLATWHLNAGHEPVRTERSAHPSLVPFQLFKGSDDEWFVVGCAKQKFYERVVEIIDRPDLGSDEHYATFATRLENREALIAELDDAFAQRPADAWIASLREAGVPTGPIQDVATALTDDHTLARDLITETEHPAWGTVRSVASPIRVGDSPKASHRRAPMRNEDAVRVLEEVLGYGDETIASLTKAGAFGDTQ